ELVAACRHDRDHVAQVRLARIADADLEPARSRQRRHFFGNVGVAREPAHMGTARPQQAQFGERSLARSDQSKGSGGGVEEDRKETHRASSAKLLTRMIFYI